MKNIATGTGQRALCTLSKHLPKFFVILQFLGAETLAADSILGWGNNVHGQLAVPTTVGIPLSVSIGGGHGIAIRQAGGLVAWGLNSSGQR